jgi:hypothetical protein
MGFTIAEIATHALESINGPYTVTPENGKMVVAQGCRPPTPRSPRIAS